MARSSEIPEDRSVSGTAPEQQQDSGQDGLVDLAISTLNIDDGELTGQLRPKLVTTAHEFVLDRSIEPLFERPGPQKTLVRRLSRTLAKALEIAIQLGPEYRAQISSMAERRTSESLAGGAELCNLLACYTLAAREFETNYFPPAFRPADWPLENAIRNLVEVIERATGRAVLISPNKNNDRNPEPRSAEAAAICALIQGLDPQLPVTTIINMIDKVKGGTAPSEHHFDAIMRADPHAETDMCLHPRRNEAG